MALQLLLSFGHIHLDKFASVSKAATVAETKAPASRSSLAQFPADDDDYCAICAAIHLTSTSFLPGPPQLPQPLVSRTVDHFNRVLLISIAQQRAAFQSRAPPHTGSFDRC